MSNVTRKLSNFSRFKFQKLEDYIRDVDKDLKNLFEEKNNNLLESKRYSYLAAVGEG